MTHAQQWAGHTRKLTHTHTCFCICLAVIRYISYPETTKTSFNLPFSTFTKFDIVVLDKDFKGFEIFELAILPFIFIEHHAKVFCAS